jgi:N-acyl-L-homoserine lactone synthetase
MTDLFSFATAHLFGDALPASLKLRHKIFVERQRYEVPSFRGMEYDAFDTPVASYLLWRNSEGRPGAIARLIPTTERYMLRELWPTLADHDDDLPCSPTVWEVSRFGVDTALGSKQRRAAIADMMCSLAEFARACRVSMYLFVAHPTLVRNLIAGAAPVQAIGPTQQLGRFAVMAAKVPVTEDALEKTLQIYKVPQPVLNTLESESLHAPL